MVGYPDHTVEVASESEPRWLAGKLVDKHLAVCTDMAPDCRWPKTLFLSLLGDRQVSVERKNEHPTNMDTEVQLLLLTNTGIPWADVQGEVKRRVVVFHFGTLVVNPSPLMQRAVTDELPKLMAKGAWAYHELMEEVGDGDLWTVLRRLGNGYFERAQGQAIQ